MLTPEESPLKCGELLILLHEKVKRSSGRGTGSTEQAEETYLNLSPIITFITNFYHVLKAFQLSSATFSMF